MNNTDDKRLTQCTRLAIVGMLIFLALVLVCYPVSSAIFPRESVETLDSWTDGTGQPTSLPAKLEGEGASSVSTVLGDAFRDNQSILFHSTHQKVRVFLDGTEIYQSGWEAGRPAWVDSPGSRWNLVELPENSAGKTLTIQLTAAYENLAGVYSEVRWGNASQLIGAFIYERGGSIVVGCISLFVGAIALLLHLFTRKRSGCSQGLDQVGLFSVLITVWAFCQNGILQFFIPSSQALYFIDFFSFYLFAIPFNQYLYRLIKSPERRGLQLLCYFYLLNAVGATVLQRLGVIDIYRTLFLTHVAMAGNLVLAGYLIWRESREDRSLSWLFRSFYLVMILAACEIAQFYMSDRTQTSFFLQLGGAVFVVSLLSLSIYRYYSFLLEREKLDYYEMLANTDLLTGARSRNAYERALKSYQEGTLPSEGVSVLLFDLNNLKYINDTYTHSAGDEALRACYTCIRAAFGQNEACFRTGGDEFVCLLPEKKENMEACMKRFEQMVQERDEKVEYPFSVSYGYACFDGKRDRTLLDTIRRSDLAMYEDKRSRHERLGVFSRRISDR